MPNNNVLPSETTANILSRLPLKSLLRFRCVCKSWFQLLTGQVSHLYFTKLHADQQSIANPNPTLIQIWDDEYRKKSSNSFIFAPDCTYEAPIELELPDWYTEEELKAYPLRCYGICNGLLCMKSCRTEADKLHIWNPFTRESTPIPCTPYKSHESCVRRMRIDYGFGFCEGSKEYKVVGVVVSYCWRESGEQHDHRSEIVVYTMGRNSWRRAGESFLGCVEQSGALVDGAFHWFVHELGFDFRMKLVSFDLESENCQEIVLPEGLLMDNKSSVKELSGKLAIFYDDYKNDVVIWVMKEYGVGNSWSKQFSIAQYQKPTHWATFEPFSVANDGDVVILKNSHNLVLLDPETNDTMTISLVSIGGKFCEPYLFKWSLVSPRHITMLKPVSEESK